MNFVSRHPIEDFLADVPAERGVNHLSLPRNRALWSVLAHKGDAGEVGQRLAAVEGISVRFCGPQEWLVVADRAEAEHARTALLAIPGLSVVEQSDGRTLFSLSGPNIRALLAKCTALDLHPSVFGVGNSASTLVCHASGNVARVGSDIYEITVMRSFAVAVFAELRLLGREFALTASFAD